MMLFATDTKTPFEPPETPEPDAPFMPPDPSVDPDVPERPHPNNVPDLPDRPRDEPRLSESLRALGEDDDDPIYPEDPPIEEPDPLEPPIEEPPPGWGAMSRAHSVPSAPC